MSTTPKVAVSDVKAALTAAVGADAVTTAPEELDAYTADTYWPALAATAAGTPLARPEIVVRPRTEEDVAAVLAAADEQRTPVVAWGGGSGTQGGALAIHGGIVIDLSSLDRILDVDEISMTVTAQAGVNGRRLEDALNARGLMFPHYPASVDLATVGGYIAARGSGVLSTRYGKIEDLLLNLRVATPATGLIETVEVPRHAVGPELTQLFVGIRGHARRDNERDPPARADARRAALCRGRVPVGRRGHSRDPADASGGAPSVGGPHVRRGRHAARVLARGGRGPARRLHRHGLRGRGRGRGGGGAPGAADCGGGRRRAARPRPRAALVGPALRLLPTAAPARAAGDLGHARRSGYLRARRGGLRRAPQGGARALWRHGARAPHALLALVPVGHDDLRPLRRARRRARTRSRCTTGSGRTG